MAVSATVDIPANAPRRMSWSVTRRDALLLLLVFVITRVVLTGAGVATMRFVPSVEGPEYAHLLDGGPALDMWYRWDAGFYTSIATYGYNWVKERTYTPDMAFLPVYPLAIHLVSGLTNTGCALSPYLSTCTTLGALLISNIALLTALLLLFDLTQHHFSRAVAWRAALLLLISPISIFLSGIYTESLFLVLSVLVFWLLARDKFELAVIAAAIASLTRSVGVALFLPLLWVAWRSAAPVRPYRLALAFVPALLLGGYILFIGATVSDPLAFFKSYSMAWGRSAGSPLQAFTVYFSGAPVSFFGWSPAWQDLIMTCFYLALAIILLTRKQPDVLRIWGLFALFALLIPIASGSLLSMPRYGATLFPFYVLLARWADRLPKQVIIYGSAAALALFMLVRFVTWRWIA